MDSVASVESQLAAMQGRLMELEQWEAQGDLFPEEETEITDLNRQIVRKRYVQPGTAS